MFKKDCSWDKFLFYFADPLFCNGILYFYWFCQDTQIGTWTLFSFLSCKKVNINYVKYIFSYFLIGYFMNFINSQYFWKWTNANPMKFFGQAATASKLYIRLKLSLG